MKDTYYILIKVPIGKSDQYSSSVDTWTGLIKDHNLLLPRSNIVKTQQCVWFHQVAMAHLSVSIIFPHCTIVYVHTICANKTLLYCQKLESKILTDLQYIQLNPNFENS